MNDITISKAISLTAAVEMIPDGASLMIGGFMAVGSPRHICEEIVRQGKKGLTVIGNDTARPDYGIGLLVSAHCVAKVIASHIGLNPETQRQMLAGETEVELVPQGTLAERIRAAGVGLGGVITPTAVGTLAAEGKQTITLDGKDYLIEKPLYADFALLGASRVDYLGNVEYALTARNFNPLMAMAGAKVIVEPDTIVPVGVLPPDTIVTQHVLVDHFIERRNSNGR